MSTMSWVSFFKEAGIPSPLAENYGALFEDNRITREMLMDLNKELLQDVGISVVGDIIAILKHAKKAHQVELKTKPKTGVKKSAAAVAPIVSASPTEAVKGENEKAWPNQTTPKELSDVQYTTTAYKDISDDSNAKEISVGTLRSDRMQPATKELSTLGPLIHEEYTTAAYEARLQMKGSTTATPVTKVSKTQSTVSKPASTRVVIMPSSSGEEKSSDATPFERSKRFLEAAGCFHSGSTDPVSFSPPARQSVFSRLELPAERLPKHTTSPPVVSNIKSRLGKRNASPPMSSPSLSVSPKFGKLYSDGDTGTVHSRLGPRQPIESVGGDICTPTMVADRFSKHSDVHARLKKKGITVLSNKGPLGKRLGDHVVFSRLE